MDAHDDNPSAAIATVALAIVLWRLRAGAATATGIGARITTVVPAVGRSGLSQVVCAAVAASDAARGATASIHGWIGTATATATNTASATNALVMGAAAAAAPIVCLLEDRDLDARPSMQMRAVASSTAATRSCSVFCRNAASMSISGARVADNAALGRGTAWHVGSNTVISGTAAAAPAGGRADIASAGASRACAICVAATTAAANCCLAEKGGVAAIFTHLPRTRHAGTASADGDRVRPRRECNAAQVDHAATSAATGVPPSTGATAAHDEDVNGGGFAHLQAVRPDGGKGVSVVGYRALIIRLEADEVSTRRGRLGNVYR